MDWTQALTIILSIGIPMITGFGWVIHKITCIDQRLSRMEGAQEERRFWETRKIGGEKT